MPRRFEPCRPRGLAEVLVAAVAALHLAGFSGAPAQAEPLAAQPREWDSRDKRAHTRVQQRRRRSVKKAQFRSRIRRRAPAP